MSTRLDEIIERVTTVDMDVDLEKAPCCGAIVPAPCDRTAQWLERSRCSSCGPVAHIFCDIHRAAADRFWTQPGYTPIHIACSMPIRFIAWVRL